LGLDVVVALILAYFVSTSKHASTSFLRNWVPASFQSQVSLALDRLSNRLSRWVWAQLALAAYLGIAYSIGLTVIGVPFALTIGLVGGILEIVPYLGGLSALSLAVISALTVRPLLVVWVILVHIIVVEVEGHLLAPALFGKVVGLHPAAILVALLVGIKSGGIVGVFFAVPATVVLLTVLDEVRVAARSLDTAASGGPDV
jgi:predicted PurR-regulated permease PerM